MLLNFYKNLTATFMLLAAKAHSAALSEAKSMIKHYGELIKMNSIKIQQLVDANDVIKLEIVDLQDWVDNNSEKENETDIKR